MKNRPILSGIHHITAITSSAAENIRFYEQVLGLRLVKKTVNFDDPYTYHLYYGDRSGQPGTIITFFPWEHTPRGRVGSGMVAAIAFAVPLQSIDFWRHRMAASGIDTTSQERFGDPVIRFSDPHGLPLELVGIADPPGVDWPDGSSVPAAHAIAGFHSATALVSESEGQKAVLADILGVSLVGREDNRMRFSSGNSRSPGQLYDVVVDPHAPPGKPGSGTVHHIAFRTPDDASQAAWQSLMREAGLAVTGVRDRKYFRSIYFNAPQGILFEVATDAPGFTIDESVETLGATLRLPKRHEAIRSQIEALLPPLELTEETGNPYPAQAEGRLPVT